MSFWNKIKESANKIAESDGWENLKNSASNVGCKVGIHSGTPLPVKDKPQCHLEYTCTKCNKLISKEKHKFALPENTRYNVYNSCEKQLKCEYCNEIKTITVHQKWESIGKDAYCNIIEQCTRCKTKSNKGKSHHFYRVGTQDSKIKIKCFHCSATELRDTWHN